MFAFLGPSIKYVRKIFRKTNISNPLIRIRGLEMLVFRKILRTYLMDDPFYFQYLCYYLHKTRKRIFKSCSSTLTFFKIIVFRCNEVMICQRYIKVKFLRFPSQLTFTCSKLKMERLDYCVKPVRLSVTFFWSIYC